METLVYVIGLDGKPEMPCRKHGKVRHLVESGRAKWVKNTIMPTLQLTYPQEKIYLQKVSLGIDEGAKHIGISATSHGKELLSMETEIRSDEVTSLKKEQKDNRKDRRNRKTRYRPCRFNNRGNFKKKDGLSLTAKHREDTHVRIIQSVHRILPISSQTLEEAKFDTQMIVNPDISGTEYQHGQMEGHENFKAFIRYRDKSTCAICGKKTKGEVHHIIPRSKGGTDRLENGVFLCEKCHRDLHQGKASLPENLELAAKSSKSLKAAAAMNTMSKRLVKRVRAEFPDIPTYRTFGSITKARRNKHGIEKSHAADARMISGDPTAEPLGYVYYLRQLRRHNRKMHEHQPRIRKAHDGKSGMSRANRKKHGYVRRECRELKSVFGFTKRSIVLYDGKKWIITGLRKEGYFSLSNIDDKQEKINSIKYTKIKLIKPQYKSIVIKDVKKI